MVRSQAREPRHDARKQREAASRNEQANGRNEKTANDASDSRPATESAHDSLQRCRAAISDGCQGQEWQRETEAVEREEKCCAGRVASSRRDAEDRAKDDPDAGRPGDSEGTTEQETADVATAKNRGWRAHSVKWWNAQDASKVQAANRHRNADGNLQDRQESTGGASNVACADPKGDEDQAKASSEEECVT
jgi:hypothetical protein